MQPLFLMKRESYKDLSLLLASLDGSGDSGVDALAVTEDGAGRGRTVLTRVDGSGLVRTNTNDLGVDGARDAVRKTDVELGEDVLGVDRGVREVTDGSGLNHVLDGVALDGLVLIWSAAILRQYIAGTGRRVKSEYDTQSLRRLHGSVLRTAQRLQALQ